MGTIRVVEDVTLADVGLEVDAADLDDLFATAARALAELAVEPATLAPAAERSVALEAPDLELLLYDWLAELVFLKDSERTVFPEAAVRVTSGSPCRLTAVLRGGRIERGRTVLRADAKAVTFHQFALEHGPAAGWRARFVVDV
jgi:SHS2 domain-containing protein